MSVAVFCNSSNDCCLSTLPGLPSAVFCVCASAVAGRLVAGAGGGGGVGHRWQMVWD